MAVTRILFTAAQAAALTTLLSACAATPEKTPEASTEPAVFVSDYPTQDRIEYVFNCVAQHGGLTYITQYACGCKVDKIAEKMPFEEYDAAKTISYLKNLPGEGGSVFRDPKRAKDLRKKLKEAEDYAEKSCFVK
ncbi:MAG: hypothetical protein CTY34_00315 [Methylobacter sp.]|nr:MAG: hypothetical protein CTY34_00315 [Methylobacter sp.]